MFKVGVRFPLHPAIVDILSALGVTPSQLPPNSWRTILSYISLWKNAFTDEPSADVFLACYNITSSSKQPGYYHPGARRSEKKLLHVAQTSNHDWKKRFFFVSGEWEFSAEASPAADGPRVPCRWSNPSMKARSDPGLSLEEKDIVEYLRGRGRGGEIAKFEDLMTPRFLKEAGLRVGRRT